VSAFPQDLNLLKLLVTIGETLNLSRAAEELNISQPALSYSLKKLREDFDDPLFVRTSHGFQPTPRALEILPKIKTVLEISQALYTPTKFDLKNYERTVTLALTTYFEAIAIVPLMRRLEKEAPKVNLKTISLQGNFPKQELESGEADLAVAAYFQELPESYYVQVLGKDRHVVLARRNHPYLKSGQTLKDYLSYPHVKIGVPANTISQVDQILAEKKLSRNLIGNFNNFLSPLIAVTETDCLLTLPERLAQTFEKMADVKMGDVPLKDSFIEVKMAWHGRFQNDPFHQWLRQTLREIWNR
jgi:DNA-binding transcriptional LysR family regulator